MKAWSKGALWGLCLGIALSVIFYFLGNWPGYSILILLLFPIATLIVLGIWIGSWIDYGKEKFDRNKGSTGLGITGFILGLLSIILFTSSFAGLIALLGIILSSIQIKRNKTKLAITGLILSIIGIVLSIIIFLVGFVAIKNLWSK